MPGNNKERAVTKSLAAALPFLSDETRDSIDKNLARVLVGLKSQVFGLDKEGNSDALAWLRPPESRQEMMARLVAGVDSNRDERSLPGLLNTVLALPAMVMPDKYAPKRSQRAVKRQEELFEALRKEAGLEAPVGFTQNAMESAGEMLGQLPIGSMRAAKAVKTGPIKKILGSIPEYLSPTIEPSVANYGTGAIAGGGLKTLAEPEQYADGGKVFVLKNLVERLQGLFSGETPTSAHTKELLDGLGFLDNVGYAPRHELHRLSGISSVGDTEQQRSDASDQLLNHLAEVYLYNPRVTPKNSIK